MTGSVAGTPHLSIAYSAIPVAPMGCFQPWSWPSYVLLGDVISPHVPPFFCCVRRKAMPFSIAILIFWSSGAAGASGSSGGGASPEPASGAGAGVGAGVGGGSSARTPRARTAARRAAVTTSVGRSGCMP
jgi:hypothetical protein